jgi:hypothetical protein
MKYVGELRRKHTKKKNESNQLRVSVSGARASNTGPSALICPVDKKCKQTKETLSLSSPSECVFHNWKKEKNRRKTRYIDGGKKERRNQQ